MTHTTSGLPSIPHQEDGEYVDILNDSLKGFFKDALRVALRSPAQAYFFLRTVWWQRKAVRLRAKWAQESVHVPPILIFSVTNRCNLQCKGCYHQALHRSSQAEMSADKLRSIVEEADQLGISFVVLAGGEPLVRREILDITVDFPQIVFLMFTNGLLLEDGLLSKLRKQRNVVPVVSLEGYEEGTDQRRGKGVYGRLHNIIGKLKSKGIFFGTSLTLTMSTFTTLTDEGFVHDLADKGCKLFFFLEYTPIMEGTDGWSLTDGQRASVPGLMESFRAGFPSLFVAVPWDEEDVGGCLSAGRGFVHISASGDLEPCPFAPFSDTNLRDMSLRDALGSELLKTIRQNREQLHETAGGCALWERREWVRSLLH